ncbi:MAG TPA: BON domain-containing protein [Vicinamibacterales bacterium]|nr:BON domain-containing protein [Vicinamibacterales bacterium]
MNTAMRSWMCGVGVGAGLTFLFDPDRGARRRALIRDKVVRTGHKTRDALGATGRDLGNRFSGAMAEARGMFGNDTADDRVLGARVRSELGRVASHPRAIDVDAVNGVIVLSGHALASEVPGIISAALGVRGVCRVHDNLTAHESAEDVPELQGDSPRPRQWRTWLSSGWSPTAIVVAGTATAAAIATAVALRRAA